MIIVWRRSGGYEGTAVLYLCLPYETLGDVLGALVGGYDVQCGVMSRVKDRVESLVLALVVGWM